MGVLDHSSNFVDQVSFAARFHKFGIREITSEKKSALERIQSETAPAPAGEESHRRL
jgi:hypothetical protein